MSERDTRNRLAFVRYLATLGDSQARMAEPMCAASVLTLHDAMEMFLLVAAEKVQAKLNKNTQFEEYWAPIDEKLSPKGLSHKTAAMRFNKARVNMKHHGTAPARGDIEGFRALARDFFEDNTPVVFGINFQELSLIDLVAVEEVRSWMNRARSFLAEGKRDDALGALDIGFKLLVKTYTDNKRNAWGGSEFFIETIPFPPRVFAELEDFGRKVSKSLEQIQERLLLLAIGVDFRKYVRFQLLTPRARAEAQEVVIYRRPDDASEDAFQFCEEFLIHTALTLQEVEFEVRHPKDQPPGTEGDLEQPELADADHPKE